MKKYISSVLVASVIYFFTGCTSLDLDPVSSVSDSNYWKTADQYNAFINGLHKRFREHSYNFFILGETRSDVYGDNPFGGEAPQGMERFPYNTLNSENAGLSNYAGFYDNINQLNLYISKAKQTNVIDENTRNYSLGQVHGMRAFYYFQLIRSWGNVIITTEPTLDIDISSLAKPVSPASQVMDLIKADIDESTKYFGSDYSFKGSPAKGQWSKAATLMLKSEVYLWTSRQMNGGTTDAMTAKNALTDIQQNVSSLGLMEKFSDVFDYGQKGNKEIIFAIRNQLKEAPLWTDENGSSRFTSNMLPQNNYLVTYYDEATGEKFNTQTENMFGLIRLGIKKTNFARFSDLDSRKRTTLKGAFNKLENNTLDIVGVYCYKFQGINDAGNSRSMNDDYPIYRYADLLLMLAEAKSLLGEDPAEEINLVRKRAYGQNYDLATIGFPNQAIDKDVNEAILEERFFELMIEGRRWYDLRRFGDEYVFKYTSADKSDSRKLLWPIDKTTLTNNRDLTQTPGY